MIPASLRFDQSTMHALLEADPLIADYRAFFALFDWSVVDHWQTQQSACCGSHGHPLTAYLKAFLIRLKEGLTYSTRLRDFLLKHPLLVIELGFQLHLDPTAPYGFDVEQTLPTRYWFGEKLRHLDPELLQALLQATVVALQHEIPGLGEVMAFDVKHIYAWVKENNPRVYVKERYDKPQVLAGDPDCKLGVKRSSNRDVPQAGAQPEAPSAAQPTPTTLSPQQDGSSSISASTSTCDKKKKKGQKQEKEYLWGYGSGVAAATDPIYGDVVFADDTLTFNQADLTYFRPLQQRAVLACGQYPVYLAADAAVPLRKVTTTTFAPDITAQLG